MQNWEKWLFGSVAPKPELLLYCDSLGRLSLYAILFTSFHIISYHFISPSALPSAPEHPSPPKPRSLRPAGLKPPPQHWRPTSGRSCSGHAVPGGDHRSLRKLNGLVWLQKLGIHSCQRWFKKKRTDGSAMVCNLRVFRYSSRYPVACLSNQTSTLCSSIPCLLPHGPTFLRRSAVLFRMLTGCSKQALNSKWPFAG